MITVGDNVMMQLQT